MLRKRLVGLFVGLLLCHQALADALTIFTFAVPAAIQVDEGNAQGPAIDSLNLLFKQLNIEAEYQVQPFARVMQSAQVAKNTCSFPMYWSQERSALLDYRLMVSPVEANIYALASQAYQREKLSKAHIVTLNHFATNSLLDDLKARYLVVSDPLTAVRMLMSNRTDYVFMDASMALAIESEQREVLVPVDTLYQGGAWLACHPDTDLINASQAQEIYNALVAQPGFKHIWSQAGLHELYDYMWGENGRFWAIQGNRSGQLQ